MSSQNPTSVDLPSGNATGAKGDLTVHEQKIIDYALHSAGAALSAKTEELVIRTRTAISAELDHQFRAYTRITTGRRVIMAVAGVAAFGLGFLVRGWIVGSSSDDGDVSNGVHE